MAHHTIPTHYIISLDSIYVGAGAEGQPPLEVNQPNILLLSKFKYYLFCLHSSIIELRVIVVYRKCNIDTDSLPAIQNATAILHREDAIQQNSRCRLGFETRCKSSASLTAQLWSEFNHNNHLAPDCIFSHAVDCLIFVVIFNSEATAHEINSLLFSLLIQFIQFFVNECGI